jgi:adenine-specific DNA glycosylase
LRFEFGAVLCKCECHSSCPVSGPSAAIPERTWRESCTCPRTEQERQRRAAAGAEFPDFQEYLAQSRRRSQSRREAFDAAKTQAGGKTREQIRDLYKTELRTRGWTFRPTRFWTPKWMPLPAIIARSLVS